MIDVIRTRALYESHAGPERNDGKGRRRFVNLIRHGLGLCDENGSNYRDRCGNRVLRESESSFTAEEFSLQETAEAIIGPSWRLIFDPTKQVGLSQHNAMLESQFGGDPRALLEGVGAGGIDVSSFADINAWTGVTGGLLERKILERMNRPELIMDQIMPDEPTRVAEGQKIIGVSRIGDLAEERQPGEPHKRAGFGERYVTLQKTRENALAIDVKKEAVFFDYSGQVMEEAEAVGDAIYLRKEFDKIDAFIGVTTTSTGKYKFTYKGTAYAFYQTVAPFTNGWVNSQANELIDWTAFETLFLAFVRMVDPETGIRIGSRPNRLLVNPKKLATAGLVLRQTTTERRNAASSTQANAALLNVGVTQMNPVDVFGQFPAPYWSPFVEQRCTDASGLGLSQANADKYWWGWDSNKPPMKYYANWPVTITQAPAQSYDMIDRGVVFSMFVNERGMPGAINPWGVVLNTN